MFADHRSETKDEIFCNLDEKFYPRFKECHIHTSRLEDYLDKFRKKEKRYKDILNLLEQTKKVINMYK